MKILTTKRTTRLYQFLFFIFLLFSFSQLRAQSSTPVFGQPGYSGSGCPANSTSISKSPDEKQLWMFFDPIEVGAGDDIGVKQSRKLCHIAIPVHVQPGYQVQIKPPEYSGFVGIPEGASASFSIHYYWNPNSNYKFVKSFTKKMETGFKFPNFSQNDSFEWSECGESRALRFNFSVSVTTNKQGESSVAILSDGSESANSGAFFELKWRRCQ